MSAAAAIATADAVWRWLAAVPDPEIPVVSVVDLGIVRDVAVTDGAVVVRITPTYSGCPATTVIRLEIETALRAQGSTRCEWRRCCRRPGRRARSAPMAAPNWPLMASRCPMTRSAAPAVWPPLKTADVACPRCQSPATEVVSPFGSTPCKAAFRCTACGEPFDYFKAI